MVKVVSLIFLVFSPLLAASFSLSAAGKWNNEVPVQEPAAHHVGRSLPLSDFESGAMSPWIDESAADARWVVEDFGSPIDATQPAPQPASGTKYLRVTRPAGTTGQAVLRSEPFMVDPGDQITLNFWIRSQIIQTNNLEVNHCFHRFFLFLRRRVVIHF